jgi:hypothetical protein
MWRFLGCAVWLAGCVNKAPADQDSLGRALWSAFREDDATLREHVLAAHDVFLAEDLKNGERSGSLSDLRADDLRMLDDLAPIPDPSRARGYFFMRRVRCSFAQMDSAFATPEQTKLHPKVYDAYQRRYDGDVDAYLAGGVATISWSTDISATILGSKYEETLRIDMRRIKGEGTRDPLLVSRAYMVRPAVFANGSDVFAQDYVLEIVYPLDAESMVYFYLGWREMKIGTFSTDDDLTLAVTFGQLSSFQGRVEDACRSGRI